MDELERQLTAMVAFWKAAVQDFPESRYNKSQLGKYEHELQRVRDLLQEGE